VYPGADDNASGVAMMLELARSFAGDTPTPRRSLMFVGFDLEEIGLFGSRYFVEHPPVPLSRVALFVTADMIGRSLGGVCEPYVFVMGTEHAPGLRPWLSAASRGSTVKVGLLGSDLLLLDRSDYGPFRARKIPYLFFSTGETPVYHTPRDTADTLNYVKLTAISRIVHAVTREAANSDRVPPWSPRPEHSLAEAETIRDVLRTLMEHRVDLRIGPAQALLIGNALRTLDAVAERGSITPEERSGVIRVAQFVLISLF
jgi:Zn-dependent M28 family amino/carboxypeptidase